MLHSSRLLHHLWLDEADARRAVPPALAQRLARLVAESEARHEGEVRLCVEGSLPISYDDGAFGNLVLPAAALDQRSAANPRRYCAPFLLAN